MLAGHSFYGRFTIHTMVSRPELFDSYVAVSPALQWDNQVAVKRADDLFQACRKMIESGLTIVQ